MSQTEKSESKIASNGIRFCTFIVDSVGNFLIIPGLINLYLLIARGQTLWGLATGTKLISIDGKPLNWGQKAWNLFTYIPAMVGLWLLIWFIFNFVIRWVWNIASADYSWGGLIWDAKMSFSGLTILFTIYMNVLCVFHLISVRFRPSTLCERVVKITTIQEREPITRVIVLAFVLIFIITRLVYSR